MSFADKLARRGRPRTRWCAWASTRNRRSFRTASATRPAASSSSTSAIIDATRDLVCAYKPQFAHYAAHAAENQLEHTIDYIKSTCPNAIVILDSKRGDIGSTAEQYAQEAFERYDADAVTVNPYLGRDSVEPFLKHGDKGVIILCRTSNPGAKDFQDLDVGGGKKLFQHVAERVAKEWNTADNCMLVVGATYPEELADIRSRVGDLPFLVPGVGAQGGDVAKVMAAGKTAAGTGLVISSSRAILYASSGDDFATAARKAAQDLRDSINAHRALERACSSHYSEDSVDNESAPHADLLQRNATPYCVAFDWWSACARCRCTGSSNRPRRKHFLICGACEAQFRVKPHNKGDIEQADIHSLLGMSGGRYVPFMMRVLVVPGGDHCVDADGESVVPVVRPGKSALRSRRTG